MTERVLTTAELNRALLARQQLLEGFQRRRLDAALDDRSVVQATLMRVTSHLVAAAEVVCGRLAAGPIRFAGLKTLVDAELAAGVAAWAGLPRRSIAALSPALTTAMRWWSIRSCRSRAARLGRCHDEAERLHELYR